ncbi:spore germination protein [Ectobacillus ponti]|uniref:spore germination protein n=1 Tax=Ectobacillus ponti TaxID=2961894 RepID=UPI003F67C506
MLPQYLSRSASENMTLLKGAFRECADAVFREVHGAGASGMLVYLDGLVKTEDLELHVLDHLLAPDEGARQLKDATSIASVKTTAKWEDVVHAILDGDAALLVEGADQALLLSVRGGTRRGVQEPASETVIRGPREGFTESLRVNTSLVRFRLKTADFKLISFTIGTQTRTKVELAYVEGIAKEEIIEEAKKRLSAIEIDGVLESAYLEELMEDNRYSPFPQLQHSERPDTVAALLLEGRFAVFTDGTPFVLLGPVTAWQMLQASEDYYDRYMFANFIRWLRLAFLFVALFTPGLYIAIITYHQDLLPTTLILSIAAAREAIPFPAFVEAIIMELAFEALREAGIRLPKTVGQAVSILGALVIGQAAVQAGIVSAPMVIIVSLTGIASFTIPKFNFAISVRLLRFPIMLFAAIFGLFGIIICTMWICTHLATLTSFGVPYLSGIAPYKKGEAKDILARAPWWKMKLRPATFVRGNRKRLVGREEE